MSSGNSELRIPPPSKETLKWGKLQREQRGRGKTGKERRWEGEREGRGSFSEGWAEPPNEKQLQTLDKIQKTDCLRALETEQKQADLGKKLKAEQAPTWNEFPVPW